MRRCWWLLAIVACKSQPRPPPENEPPPKVEAPLAPPPVATQENAPSPASAAAPLVLSKPEELDAALVHVPSATAIDVIDRHRGGSETTLRTIAFRIDRQGQDFVAKHAGKKRNVRREVVEAFLKSVARKIDDVQSHHRGNLHPDDYPDIRVTLAIPGRGEIRLTIEDDQRHWMANGFFLEGDGASDGSGDVLGKAFHPRINAAYAALLDAATGGAAQPKKR
jgi:hypothetical protein